MPEYLKQLRAKVGNDLLLLVGAGVVIHNEGQILLQKRQDNDCWASHGGIIEPGEEVETAAKRELYEETGLTANQMELLGIFSGKDFLCTYPNGDKVAFVIITYITNDFSGELITQTNETTDLKWFPLNDLPENITPIDIPIIKKAISHLTQSTCNE